MKGWAYSELSKLAKRSGGPRKFLRKKQCGGFLKGVFSCLFGFGILSVLRKII